MRNLDRLRLAFYDVLIGWHDGRRQVHDAAFEKWCARFDKIHNQGR